MAMPLVPYSPSGEVFELPLILASHPAASKWLHILAAQLLVPLTYNLDIAATINDVMTFVAL